MSAGSADGDLDNLYAYIHREHVWGVNVAPPEDARRVIKPWDARMSHEHASSGVDDQMIFNIPFALPVRVRAVVLNTGSGDFAPQRCSVFVNRPNGIDFGDVDAATAPSRDSRSGAPPGSGQPQADFALLDGFHIYPVSASRFMHTNSAPKPHPSAPKEVADSFDHFRKVFETGPHFDPSKRAPAAPGIVDDLHQLPRQFWDTPALRWSNEELEAVMVRSAADKSGGASAVVP